MPAIESKLVIVTPNVGGDTLTARATHDGVQIGKLNRGEIYWAVEEYKGMYRLVKHITPFPFRVASDVWASATYLPDYVPGDPDPDPIPVGDGSLKSLAAKLGHALIEWSEE